MLVVYLCKRNSRVCVRSRGVRMHTLTLGYNIANAMKYDERFSGLPNDRGGVWVVEIDCSPR